jgi:serine/threonine protein kinase
MIFKGFYNGSIVAAKQLLESGKSTELEKEIAALGKLSHPHILQLYGISRNTDGDIFMVMEFCGGGDLHDYYHHQDFTVPEFRRVMIELLSGLCYMHQRNLAHRDLKPANVLLEASSRKVKIADFGLAKDISATATQSGAGTPLYMPPELFDVEYEPDRSGLLAVDIYAMAIIFWELWYRIAPFQGIPVRRFTAHVLCGKRLPLVPIENIEPMPERLQELIRKCWAQDPLSRPESTVVARDFAESIPETKTKSEDILGIQLKFPEHIAVGDGPKTIRDLPLLTARRLNAIATRGAKSDREINPRQLKPKIVQGISLDFENVKGKELKHVATALRVHDGADSDCTVLTESSTSIKHRSPAVASSAASQEVAHVTEFLESVGLEWCGPVFTEFGFADLESLNDRDLLDDTTLLTTIGLTKTDLLRFRAGLVAFIGKNPAVMATRTRARLLEARQRAGKAEATDMASTTSPGSGHESPWL